MVGFEFTPFRDDSCFQIHVCLVGIVIIMDSLIQGWKHKRSTLLGLAVWGLLASRLFFMFDPILWNSPLNQLIKSVNFNANYSVSQYVRDLVTHSGSQSSWVDDFNSTILQIPFPLFILIKGDFFISADSLIFILALAGLPNLLKKK